MQRCIVALVAMMLAVPAFAEGVPKQSKIWTPQQYLETSGVSAGYLYMGILGGHASIEDDLSDGTWRAGLNVGYLAKMKSLGLGIEMEALRHFDEDVQQENELNNWDFSVRARLGVFLSPTFMPYVTGGYAWRLDNDSVVYGLGAELFANERVSIRLEALKYAGDDETLDLRTGMSFKF